MVHCGDERLLCRKEENRLDTPWRILMLHGANLQALGWREPDVYGSTTLQQLEQRVVDYGLLHGVHVHCVQSNHEGVFLDTLYELRQDVNGMILNPGAWTHYSYAIRDAVAAVGLPAIEVHVTNVHQREPFRHVSVTAPVMWGVIAGLGPVGYELAVQALVSRFRAEKEKGQ